MLYIVSCCCTVAVCTFWCIAECLVLSFTTFYPVVSTACQFYCIAPVPSSCSLHVLQCPICLRRWSVLAPIQHGGSNQCLIYRLSQRLLYSATFRRIGMRQSLGTLLSCTSWSRIALQLRLSMMYDQCTRTIRRMAPVKHWESCCWAHFVTPLQRFHLLSVVLFHGAVWFSKRATNSCGGVVTLTVICRAVRTSNGIKPGDVMMKPGQIESNA